MIESVTWKIAGEAGFGIISSGVMLAKAFARSGYYVFTDNDYPSLIRGGHNVVGVRISTKPFMGMNRDLHVLVALNSESVEKHLSELHEGSMILFDPRDKDWKQTDVPAGVKLMPLPLRDIITKLNADTVMRNTITLGATVALLGASLDALSQVIHDQFIKKGQEVVDQNVNIAKAGYDYIKTTYPNEASLILAQGTRTEKVAIVNGSEALGLGAVRAGLKFAAIYPMTPINALITFLADHAKSLNLVYKQPEDEIAGINMAIGAAIAGVRSMVATSGGGFALMVEGVSLAGMIEAPVVIDLGMRAGPATGMPTYTEQGELLFVIHAGHGEFPKIVLAPSDAQEAFTLTTVAFQMAERYQIPVFVLTDKYLNESQWSVPLSVLTKPIAIDRGKLIIGDTGKAPGEFHRYDTSVADGVSPRSIPGTKNAQYYANSYEHDGLGHVTETAVGRMAMADKRLRKISAMEKDLLPPIVVGDPNADITLVTWGTTRGPVLSAAEILNAKGQKTNVVHFPWLYPFPVKPAKEIFAKSKRVIDIEQNATSQLAQLVRTETGFDIPEKITKYDGRPFFPEEIVARIEKGSV